MINISALENRTTDNTDVTKELFDLLDGLTTQEVNQLIEYQKRGYQSIPPVEKYTVVEDLNDRQFYFFTKLACSAKAKRPISVGSETTYLFAYAACLVKVYAQYHPRKAMSELQYVSEQYPLETRFVSYCDRLMKDCLLFAEDYEVYLASVEPSGTHGSNFIINLKDHLGLIPTIHDLIELFQIKVSKITKDNLKLFRYAAEKFSRNLVGSWWSKLKDEHKNNKVYGSTRGSCLGMQIDLPFQMACYYSSSEQLVSEVKEVVKQAENAVRIGLGLPKIGEGWVSETKLYQEIKRAFPKMAVVQHGRPEWLGRQHIDIWIPDHSIAVEYHGKQHFEPVDFFGGKKAFIKTVDRDRRKAKLCESKGVRLIVVERGYDIDDVVEKIRDSMAASTL